MKQMKWFWIAIVALVAAPSLAAANNVNVFLGGKTMDEYDWGPWNEQGEIGVLMDFGNESFPVSFAADILISGETAYGMTVTTSEIDLGVRKVFDLNGTQFHPYIGGGLAMIGATIEDDWSGASIDDSGMGIWISGGFFVTLGENFNLGLDLRHSSADADFGTGVNADIGGDHFGVLLGYHW